MPNIVLIQACLFFYNLSQWPNVAMSTTTFTSLSQGRLHKLT